MCRAIARCAFGPLAEEFTTSFQMPEITWIGRYLEIDMARLALLMFLLFLWWEYVLLSARDASGPEKASDDRGGAVCWRGFCCSGR